ncbi:MAG TPA: phosphate ABC transporter substrate-binding protein PstS, partial [Corynebacterium sp.]|nr:phosphate ABC transporter substrate-binding protein PstS [Corynebacterium sp.]
MIRNFKRTAAIFGVVAVGSAALVACGDSDNGTDSTATTAAEG